MKKISNRFISLLVIFALCFCTASIASAAEPEVVEPEDVTSEGSNVLAITVEVKDSPDDMVSPRSYDQLINLATTDFNWDGSCSCVLGRNFYNVGIMAGISSSSAVGNVTCSVRLPNGSLYVLGTVPASGGTTAISNFPTVTSGTYTFYFEASTGARLNGFGYIYKGN